MFVPRAGAQFIMAALIIGTLASVYLKAFGCCMAGSKHNKLNFTTALGMSP